MNSLNILGEEYILSMSHTHGTWLQDSGREDGEQGDEEEDDSPEELQEEDFQGYDIKASDAKTLELLSQGWTAFVVGVVLPA